VTAALKKDDLIENANTQRDVAIEAAAKKNQALSDAKARIEVHLADKDALLSSVALDLRGPIKSALEIANSLDKEESLGSYAREIASLGRDLARILQKAEPGAAGRLGQGTVNVENCQLKAILVRARASAMSGVNLIGLDLSGLVIDTKVMVAADFEQVCKVVEMLLGEAVGRTDEGGGVGLEVALSGGEDMVNITIWDSSNATAITQATENDAKSPANDKSLSFDQAKEILRQMGGELTREDTHRKGNCVTITLPVAS